MNEIAQTIWDKCFKASRTSHEIKNNYDFKKMILGAIIAINDAGHWEVAEQLQNELKKYEDIL